MKPMKLNAALLIIVNYLKYTIIKVGIIAVCTPHIIYDNNIAFENF